MPSATPTSPSPGPSYYWDPNSGAWVYADPESGFGGAGGATSNQGAGPPPPPPPTTVSGLSPGQSVTGANGQSYTQGSSQIIDPVTGKAPTVGGYDTGQGQTTGRDWQLDTRTVENTNNQTQLANQLQDAATNPVSRDVPQVSAGPNVTSKTTTAVTPTATLAGAAKQITAPTITDTTIAPAAQIKAATVAPTASATAGQVQAATIDTTQQGQFRTGQQDLVSQLQSAARGDVPSAAEIQGRKQADEAASTQLATVGMNHGRGANAALRLAGRNIAGIQSKAAADAAALRANEMANARSQLGTALGQGREQDIGLATKAADLTQAAGTTNAQLTTQTNISNADREAARNMKQADLEQAAAAGNAAAINELNERQAALTAQTKTQNAANELEAGKSNQASDLATQLKNAELATGASTVGATEQNKVSLANSAQDLQAQLANQDNSTKVALANAGFTLQGRSLDDARNTAAVNQALQAQEQLATSLDKQQALALARDQYNQAVEQKDFDRAMKIISTVIGTAAQVGGFIATASDERVKRDVEKVDDDAVANLARHLSGKGRTWRYKPGEFDDGDRHVGFMAQDLEKDPLGAQFVKDGDDGVKRVDYQGLNAMLLAHAIRGRREARS